MILINFAIGIAEKADVGGKGVPKKKKAEK